MVNIECIHVGKKYYSNSFLLISEYFLQYGFVHTSPSNVTIVYVTVYETKKNIFPRYSLEKISYIFFKNHEKNHKENKKILIKNRKPCKILMNKKSRNFKRSLKNQKII